MFRIELDENHDLRGVVNKFISAMLPHKNGNQMAAPSMMNHLTTYIRHDEFSLEYYVVVKLLQEIFGVCVQTGSPVYFDFHHIDTYLSGDKLVELVRLDGIGIASMMVKEDQPFNVQIPEHINTACKMLYGRVKNLYDIGMQLEISPDECMGYIPALKEQYILTLGKVASTAQNILLDSEHPLDKYRFEGWAEFLKYNVYKGPTGYVSFLTHLSSTINNRLSGNIASNKAIDMNALTVLAQAARESTSYIGYYGIPSLDVKFGIPKVNFSVLVGDPGVGKTTMAATWLAYLCAAGKKCVMFSGENNIEIILYKYLLPPYIRQRFGFFVTMRQILGQEEIEGKDQAEIEMRKKCIQTAQLEIASGDRLVILSQLTLDSVEIELQQLYNEFPFDFVVLDHAESMAGSETENLNRLSSTLLRIKRKLKTHVCLLSHAAPTWKNYLAEDSRKDTIITKNSGQFRADCDTMFLLFQLDADNAPGEACLMVPKAREENDQKQRHRLKFIFKCGTYIESLEEDYEDSEAAIATVGEDSMFTDENGFDEDL